VLAHIVHGQPAKRTARALNVSPRTIELHVRNVLERSTLAIVPMLHASSKGVAP